MTKEQRVEAKRIIKDFVKSMVKGRELHVALPNGNVRSVIVSLTRSLDTLKIKVSGQTRQIRLLDIDEIVVGTEMGESQACEGLETPLDELSVTLALTTQECITFRMRDVEQRDTFVMCLSMFQGEARQKMGS